MAIVSSFVLLLVLACAHKTASLKLPSYISACPIHHPQLSECEKVNGNAAIPELVKGDVTYKVPVLDPMIINEIRLGDASTYVHLSNITIRGLRNARITSREHDVILKRIYTEVASPLLTVDSDYNMGGNFLNVGIVGRGHNNVTMENWRVESIMDYDLIQKLDGNIHMVVKNMQAVFDTTGGKIYLDDVFNGDKALGARVNQFLNENYYEAFVLVSPGIAQVVSKVLQDVYSDLADIVPFSDIYTL